VRVRVRLVGLCDVSAIVGWLGGMMTTMMMCRVCGRVFVLTWEVGGL
jgi:maltodextrin utilization protein YvdJ